ARLHLALAARRGLAAAGRGALQARGVVRALRAHDAVGGAGPVPAQPGGARAAAGAGVTAASRGVGARGGDCPPWSGKAPPWNSTPGAPTTAPPPATAAGCWWTGCGRVGSPGRSWASTP